MPSTKAYTKDVKQTAHVMLDHLKELLKAKTSEMRP